MTAKNEVIRMFIMVNEFARHPWLIDRFRGQRTSDLAMVIWSSTVLELDFLVLCPPGAAERRSKHSIANSLISRGLLLRTLARGFKPKTVNQSSIQTHFHGTFGHGLGSLGVLRLVHLPQACRMNINYNSEKHFR